MRSLFFALLLFFAFPLFHPTELSAEPYYAVFEGASCSLCHVSPTGAGMRKGHGLDYYSKLSLESTQHLFDNDYVKGKINKYFALGGDLRVRHLATIQSPTSNSFTIPQGSLYVRVDPFSIFSIYVDTDLANVVNREAFGLIHDVWRGLWVKFGRFNLPYGLRISEDASFIRSDLGFSFAAQDIGLEVGLESGPVTVAAAYTNGVPGGSTDDNGDKAATSSVEWRIAKFLRLGGSFQWNNLAAIRTMTGGGYLGAHFWKIALLGEFDFQQVRDKSTGGERNVLAGYGEADYRIIPGLVFKGTYDVIDDKLPLGGLHHRIGAGFEIFPIPHLQIVTLYRIRIGPGTLGSDQILTLLHGFF